MGRPPCCNDKVHNRRCNWTEEDANTSTFVSTKHGIGNWATMSKKSGTETITPFVFLIYSRKIPKVDGAQFETRWTILYIKSIIKFVCVKFPKLVEGMSCCLLKWSRIILI